MPGRIVIVGASAAGLTAAEALREKGYGGTLTLVGAERHPPYDRPPLSKQILTGAWEPERAELRDAGTIGGLDAELLLGRHATGLDVAGRAVLLDGGERRPFDALVIATGAVPRRLPGCGLAGVHVLRTLDDALALRESLLGGPELVVVGAGFLGCEVAAAARRMGVRVTLADPLPVPMQRQACGVFPPDAETTVLAGDPAGRRFVVGYRSRGRVVGVLGWNHPRELIGHRRLVLAEAAGSR